MLDVLDLPSLDTLDMAEARGVEGEAIADAGARGLPRSQNPRQ